MTGLLNKFFKQKTYLKVSPTYFYKLANQIFLSRLLISNPLATPFYYTFGRGTKTRTQTCGFGDHRANH